MFPARIDLCARRDAARAACDAACDSLETRDSFSACYGEAEPMSVAAPVVRSVHPPEEALERALSDVARLRADLARRVAAAASDAVADAGETDHDREDGSGFEDSDDPDASACVDRLVTRLRALHGARDACVSQMRLEGAIREAKSAASALEAISPDALAESPAEALERLEAGVEALRAAARALAADRDESATDGFESSAASNPDGFFSGSGSAAAPPAPPKAPRFARVAARRARALAAHRLRGRAVALFANAAAASGWPCDLDQNALRRFEWAAAGDDATDPENALRRSFAACATLRAVAAAAADTESDCASALSESEETERVSGGISPGGSLSWPGEALAAPVAANLRRLFRSEPGPEPEPETRRANDLADPARPELLFACAARSIAALAPLVRETLESLDAFGEERRATSAREARAASVRFAETVAAAAAAAAADTYLPACAAAEQTARARARALASEKKAQNGANAANAEQREAALLDLPWLHLADECASFDAAVAATIRETNDVGVPGRDAYVRLPAPSSALARLASTDRAWCERWFEAELGDAARALAATCDAPGDAGWVPAGLGTGLGDEEGESDGESESSATESSAFFRDGPDVLVALPAADAACDALRRLTARALALPADARVARDGLGDLVGRFAGEAHSASASGSAVSARDAFLASTAFPLADAFARRCDARADADDAFGALAVGDGVAGMARVGHCVSAATRASTFLRAFSESAEVLAGFGADAFADQIAALERCADRWTDALVDAAFGAYANACAPYERGAHLLAFAEEASELEASSDVGGGGGVGAFTAAGSALFGSPAETLRVRLRGLRRALLLGRGAERARCDAATRTVGRLAARRFLRDVVLATKAFSRAGAARARADVDAMLGVFAEGAQKSRPPRACLAEATEAATLLTLNVREASRVATACGAAEAAAAAADEAAREAREPGAWSDAAMTKTKTKTPSSRDAGEEGPAAARARAARAAAAEAREAVGVYALDDAVAFAVLSRRVDLGAERCGR